MQGDPGASDGKADPVNLLELLAGSHDTEALLATSVDACIGCLQDGSWLQEWSVTEQDRFFNVLIEQVEANPSSPLLHHRLASMHSAGIDGILDKAATQLEPLLKRKTESGALGAGGVLMLLLLRDSLGEFSAEQISSLHKDWLPRFRFGDLAIPYNLMFEKQRFKDNFNDVAAFVDENSDAIMNGKILPFAHIVFADWLTKGMISSKHKKGRLTAVAKNVLEDERSLEADRSAARSFLVRQRLMPALAGLPDDKGTQALARVENRRRQAFHAALSVAGRYAPALHLFRRKPKVAVCVSGQLRGYEQAVSTWQATFLRDIDAHIFVDTWSRIGRSSAEPFRYVLPFEGEHFIAAYRQYCTELGQDAFVRKYPSLFRALEQTGCVDEAQLSRFFGTDHIVLDDDRQEPFRSWSNQEKMHNKIQSCFNSAFAAGDYDLMVRIRPDKPVKMTAFSWQDMRLACSARPILFADSPFGVNYNSLLIGDQFAVGSPLTMKRYADTAETYPLLAEEGLLNAPKELTGHVSLAQTCWLSGIDVRKVPIRFGPLLEPAKMKAEEIKVCLLADTVGRMDAMDQALIGANGADL